MRCQSFTSVSRIVTLAELRYRTFVDAVDVGLQRDVHDVGQDVGIVLELRREVVIVAGSAAGLPRKVGGDDLRPFLQERARKLAAHPARCASHQHDLAFDSHSAFTPVRSAAIRATYPVTPSFAYVSVILPSESLYW